MKEFDDIVSELGLTFKIAPEPDGSYEMEVGGEVVDISWNWIGDNVEALKKNSPETIWTVLDCDGELYVTNGMHYVNRLFYIVTNEPYEGEDTDFIF